MQLNRTNQRLISCRIHHQIKRWVCGVVRFVSSLGFLARRSRANRCADYPPVFSSRETRTSWCNGRITFTIVIVVGDRLSTVMRFANVIKCFKCSLSARRTNCHVYCISQLLPFHPRQISSQSSMLPPFSTNVSMSALIFVYVTNIGSVSFYVSVSLSLYMYPCICSSLGPLPCPYRSLFRFCIPINTCVTVSVFIFLSLCVKSTVIVPI